MKIAKSKIVNIYLFLLIFYFFTNYIYQIQVPIIIVLGGIFILCIGFSKLRKEINYTDILLILFPMFLTIEIFLNANNIADASKFIIVIWILTLSIILLSKENLKENQTNIINFIILLSGIHVLMTLLYAIIPDFVQNINKIILPIDSYNNNVYEMQRNHINCGITPIQSINAIYISVFIGCIFSKWICKRGNKIINIGLFILGMIALFLTSKRGVMVAVFAAILFVLMYLHIKDKNKKSNIVKTIKKVFPIILIVIILIFLIERYFKTASYIFERFFTQEDITTGRADLYVIVWKYIKSSPIIGHGLFFTQEILNTYAHNIYLQLFCETGIIGLIIFLIMNMSVFQKMCRIKKIKDERVILAIYFFIVFLVYGFTGNPLFDYSIMIPYYLSISIINNKKFMNEEKKSNDKEQG